MPIPKQTFAVLNTSGHSISGPGITLQPGLNEGVSVAAFTKAFLGADGQPTLSAAKHLNPSGDKPPALLPITVKAVPSLPQDFALQAISRAQHEDMPALQALLMLETRKPVVEATRARLVSMGRPAESPAVAIAGMRPSIHIGDEALARDYGPAFSAEAKAKASIEPRATPDEARAMLTPISHEPEPAQPTGLVFSGNRDSTPEVMNLGGGPRSFQGAPGISATDPEAPAADIQEVLTNHGEASASATAGTPRSVAEAPAREPALLTGEASQESTQAPAAAAPAEQAPPPPAQQHGRRGRRGGQG